MYVVKQIALAIPRPYLGQGMHNGVMMITQFC